MSEFERRMLAWDMYFAGVAGIQYHPGNPPESRLSLAEIGLIVDEMLIERDKRCQSGPLQ